MNDRTPQATDDLDLQIDRTLAALDSADPSPSFHARLLTTLDRSEQCTASNLLVPAEAKRSSSLRGLWRLPDAARSYGFQAAITAGVALAVALFVIFVPRHTKRTQPSQDQAHVSPITSQTPAAQPSQADILPATVRPLPPRPAIASNAHSEPAASHTYTLEITAGTPLTPDQQALADFHASSQPAPPLPPTSQERLVRLMLRRGEKTELAQLDLARNPDTQRAETAAFHNFFDPPSLTKDDTTTQDQPSPAASPKEPQP